MLTKVYYSPYQGLVINREPKVNRIEFMNGRFTTSDPEQIKLLEQRTTGFGRYIFIEDETIEEEDIEDELSYVCDVPGCGRSFATANALNAHMGAHKRRGEID